MSHGVKSDKYAGYSNTVICSLAKSLFVLAFRKARFRYSHSSFLVKILPFEGNNQLRRICDWLFCFEDIIEIVKRIAPMYSFKAQREIGVLLRSFQLGLEGGGFLSDNFR
jgi:hypothetical protein